MPRRLPIRPAKIIGNIFVTIILAYISTLYYYYVFHLWGPRIESNQNKIVKKLLEHWGAQIVLVFFHVLVFMLLWSFA
jgi:hypothetical protein